MNGTLPANMLLPPDALVLVTGVNGLIASHAADQLLAAGLRVRGTVRNLSRSAWLKAILDDRHGSGRFELFQVPDIEAANAWEEAIQGVSAVASIASILSLLGGPDVDTIVDREMAWLTNLLSLAKRTPSVKSFVLTSSIWAAYTPEPDRPMVVTEQTFNEQAVRLAAASSVPLAEKGLAPFMAAKTQIEQRAWLWIEKEKPDFTFNTILQDTVLGPVLDVANQPGSTAGMIQSLWTGDEIHILSLIPPQWFVDVRDSGLLYVAALTMGDVNRARLFGCAERYSWSKVSQLLQEMYPQKKEAFLTLPHTGWDATMMPTERVVELLRRLGRPGWISLEQSVRDGAVSVGLAA